MLLYSLLMLYQSNLKRNLTLFGFMPSVAVNSRKVVAENYDLEQPKEQNNSLSVGLKVPMVFDLFRNKRNIDPTLSRSLFGPRLAPVLKPIPTETYGIQPKQEPKYENNFEGFDLVPLMLTPFAKEPRLF
jgi:hypothetical protein